MRHLWMLGLLAGCFYTLEQAEEEWDAFVADKRACEVDDDCTSIGSQCPFGCAIPIANEFADEGEAEVQRLLNRLERAGTICDYDCPQMEVVCAGDNTCSASAVETD